MKLLLQKEILCANFLDNKNSQQKKEELWLKLR
jgi:hypothetical protein